MTCNPFSLAIEILEYFSLHAEHNVETVCAFTTIQYGSNHKQIVRLGGLLTQHVQHNGFVSQ